MPHRASKFVLEALACEMEGGAALDTRTIRRIHGRPCDVLAKGKSFLLCTDGVHDTLGEAKLQKLTDLGLAPCAQVEVWRKAILAAGAPDNFSIILLRRSAP